MPSFNLFSRKKGQPQPGSSTTSPPSIPTQPTPSSSRETRTTKNRRTRDDDDDEARYGSPESYVLPLIDTPSSQNGTGAATDYFSTASARMPTRSSLGDIDSLVLQPTQRGRSSHSLDLLRPSAPFAASPASEAGSTRSLPTDGQRPNRRPPLSNILNPHPRTSPTSSRKPPPRAPSPAQSTATSRHSRPMSPLLKLASNDPIPLSTDSESRSKIRKPKTSDAESTSGGFLSFLGRDRKKSTASGRPSFSSSRSEPGKSKPSEFVPPVPELPPLRPIPVGEAARPSVVRGFVPPVRRPRVPPPAADGLQLKSFRHVNGVESPAAAAPEPTPAPNPDSGRVSPFQGLELSSRRDSFASDTSQSKVTAGAFRQAQQKARKSASQLDLAEAMKMDAQAVKADRGPPSANSLSTISVASSPGASANAHPNFPSNGVERPIRPPRVNPPPGKLVMPPGPSASKPRSSMYDGLDDTSSEEEEEDDDDDSDDAPLAFKAPGASVQRKTTITQRSARSPISPLASSSISRGSRSQADLSTTSLSSRSQVTSTSRSQVNLSTPPTRTPVNSSPNPRHLVVNPPPRSSSLYVETLPTRQPLSKPGPARGTSVDLGSLTAYAASRGSKSLSAVNELGVNTSRSSHMSSSTTTPGKFGTHPARTRTVKDSESESSESESEDDDRPLGARKPTSRPKSGYLHAGWAPVSSSSRSEVGYGKQDSPPLSSPTSILRPPRDSRRPTPPHASTDPVPTRPKPASATLMRTADSLPTPPSSLSTSPTTTVPLRPFGSGMGMYTSSPGGSSNGDSFSSSGRLPLTPRDGSEVGTTSGSSAFGMRKSVIDHGRKASVVTFEDDAPGDPEIKRRERRRSEAKQAIQYGNAINGPPPNLSSDEDEGAAHEPPPMLAPQMTGMSGMSLLGGWDPQLMILLQAQAQQQQILQQQINMSMARNGIDPQFLNAHQQAMLFAKQAYQMTVAQQALEAAGEEWERSSNIGGGGGGGSVIGGFGGGGGSLLGGMGGGSLLGGMGGMGGGMPGMGMNLPSMGMLGMGMGMPSMNPAGLMPNPILNMGMNMNNMNMAGMGMMFPPSPGSAYGGSVAGGGNPRNNMAFSSAMSVAGDQPTQRKETKQPKSKNRSRTNTAPSSAQPPSLNRATSPRGIPMMPPPSSWKA